MLLYVYLLSRVILYNFYSLQCAATKASVVVCLFCFINYYPCFSPFGLLEQHKLGDINYRNLLLTVIKVRKPKIEVPVDPCLVEACFLVHRCPFCWALTWQTAKGAAWALIYRSSNPNHQGSTLMT